MFDPFFIGLDAADQGLRIRRVRADDRVFALAGNPNVGKSTVFNALTGMNQHTGNWPGKLVANAQGRFENGAQGVILVNIPVTYSLMAHSEEEVARDYICFGHPDGVVVVCDASCLEHSLNLVLQTMECTDQVILFVNLMDEARKKKIVVDGAALSNRLGIPVITAAAHKGEGLTELSALLARTDSQEEKTANEKNQHSFRPDADAVRARTRYAPEIEDALDRIQPELERRALHRVAGRWAALRLLENDGAVIDKLMVDAGIRMEDRAFLDQCVADERGCLARRGWPEHRVRGHIISALKQHAEHIAAECVPFQKSTRQRARPSP